MKNSKFQIPNSKKGFTLLETLAALSVLTFGVLGPLTLASYSIRSAGVSKNQVTAFYLAQEAMEYIRNRRDSNALINPTGNWLESLTTCRSSNGCTIDATLPDSDPDSVKNCSADCPKLRYSAAAGIYSYNTGGPETIFTRQIKFTRISDYEEKVEVAISWQDKFGLKTFTVEENIFDWP